MLYKGLALTIFGFFVFSGCSSAPVKKTTMVDLHYATVYVPDSVALPKLTALPNWPTDTTESRVLKSLAGGFSRNFRGGLLRRVRDCRCRFSESPEMADCSITLSFPAMAFVKDTLFLKADLQVADRRSGRKDVASFVAKAVREKPAPGDGNIPFHQYGLLLNKLLNAFPVDSMVGVLVGPTP